MKAATIEELRGMPARAIRESVRGRVKSFNYTSAPITVAAITGTVLGANETLINIDGDSHFVATALSGHYLIQSSGLSTHPLLHAEPRIQMNDEAQGRNVFDRFLAWYNVVGTGEYPTDLDPPYFLRARSAVRVFFQNPETLAYTCTVTLHGYKVYLR